MDKEPKRGMKVMLKDGLIVGNKYGDNRTYDESMSKLKGKILKVNATAKVSKGYIFDMASHNHVLHTEMVDELDQVNLDNLVSAVISGGLSEEEYEVIRRERG